jgi:uncharacterized tellurite resistance protein B-like protein
MDGGDGLNTQFEAILANEERFKTRLAIGGDAFKILRTSREIGKWWDVAGAATTGGTIAASPLVATTFFAPQGLLALLGLGTAATPIGWVIAAAVISGGAWYGLQRKLSGASETFVDEIPKYLNTPLDVISSAIFDFLGALSLKVADVDGEVHSDEIECIRNHFVDDWGYDPGFVNAGLDRLLGSTSDVDVTQVAKGLAAYKKENPDCNYEVMQDALIRFLEELIQADGVIRPEERAAIEAVGSIFNEEGMSRLEKMARESSRTVRETFESSLGLGCQVGRKARTASGKVIESGRHAVRDLTDRTVRLSEEAGGRVREQLSRLRHPSSSRK